MGKRKTIIGWRTHEKPCGEENGGGKGYKEKRRDRHKTKPRHNENRKNKQKRELSVLQLQFRFARVLGHFLVGTVFDLLGLIIVRRDFHEPSGFDFDHLAHKLFGGEDEFEVDHPSRLLLEQTRVGVDLDGMLLLYGLVLPAL